MLSAVGHRGFLKRFRILSCNRAMRLLLLLRRLEMRMRSEAVLPETILVRSVSLRRGQKHLGVHSKTAIASILTLLLGLQRGYPRACRVCLSICLFFGQ